MRVLVAPNNMSDKDAKYCLTAKAVFMAGGITGCPDWQDYVIDRLFWMEHQTDSDNLLFLMNPRRPKFDVRNIDEESKLQIKWEHAHLHVADEIYFWFPKEGKCMITLYELGYALGRDANVRIGCHPEYERAFDVYEQVRLVDPNKRIYSSVEELYGLTE